tara:strand:- start:275 stop:586 length:312 start_codon:yes stop_codon:yes gene_type:complete
VLALSQYDLNGLSRDSLLIDKLTEQHSTILKRSVGDGRVGGEDRLRKQPSEHEEKNPLDIAFCHSHFSDSMRLTYSLFLRAQVPPKARTVRRNGTDLIGCSGC